MVYKPPAGGLLKAYNKTVAASPMATEVDAALVESGRTIARQVDDAVANGESWEVTKALYLVPHMINILRELLATPAARQAAGLSGAEKPTGKLAQLRSVNTKPA